MDKVKDSGFERVRNQWKHEEQARGMIRQGKGAVQIVSETETSMVWVKMKMAQMGYPVRH
jgi:hypothetical protein